MTGGPEADLLADGQAILTDRGRQYGPPSDHHARTAAAVNAVKGWNITPRDVSEFFEIDKLVRRQQTPDDRDHYLDGANYAAISWGHQERSG